MLGNLRATFGSNTATTVVDLHAHDLLVDAKAYTGLVVPHTSMSKSEVLCMNKQMTESKTKSYWSGTEWQCMSIPKREQSVMISRGKQLVCATRMVDANVGKGI